MIFSAIKLHHYSTFSLLKRILVLEMFQALRVVAAVALTGKKGDYVARRKFSG